MKMSRTVHMAQSIRGALKNWSYPDDYQGMMDDSGIALSPFEVREYFLQALSEGKELLPMGDCEGFDFKEGCPGHPKEKA